MAEITDITQDVLQSIQADMTGLRRDVRSVQEGYLDLLRLLQRMDSRQSSFEQRLGGLKGDLETMFKMEIIGRFAHFETQIESGFDSRLAATEARLDRRFDVDFARLESHLDRIEARLDPQ